MNEKQMLEIEPLTAEETARVREMLKPGLVVPALDERWQLDTALRFLCDVVQRCGSIPDGDKHRAMYAEFYDMAKAELVALL